MSKKTHDCKNILIQESTVMLIVIVSENFQQLAYDRSSISLPLNHVKFQQWANFRFNPCCQVLTCCPHGAVILPCRVKGNIDGWIYLQCKMQDLQNLKSE